MTLPAMSGTSCSTTCRTSTASWSTSIPTGKVVSTTIASDLMHTTASPCTRTSDGVPLVMVADAVLEGHGGRRRATGGDAGPQGADRRRAAGTHLRLRESLG